MMGYPSFSIADRLALAIYLVTALGFLAEALQYNSKSMRGG